MHTQCQALFEAGAEGVVGHELCQREFAHHFQHLAHPHGAEPFALVAHFGEFRLEHGVELIHVLFAVVHDLFVGKRGSGFVASGGISDLGGKIADDDHSQVAKILKITHLANGHQMTQVHVVAGGIDAKFHAQGFAALFTFLQLLQQIFQRDDLINPAFDHLYFLFKSHGYPSLNQ